MVRSHKNVQPFEVPPEIYVCESLDQARPSVNRLMKMQVCVCVFVWVWGCVGVWVRLCLRLRLPLCVCDACGVQVTSSVNVSKINGN